MNFKHITSGIHPSVLLGKRLLILLSAVLIAANLYFLNVTRDLAQSYSDQQNEATWFLLQLTKEYSELVALTQYAKDAPNFVEQATLQYDLTWSRFDLLINNQKADSFMKLKGARSYFESAFEQFQSLEPLLLTLRQTNQASIFHQELVRLNQSMVDYVNANFRIQSPLYKRQSDQAKKLSEVQFILMTLLFSCLGLMGYVLHLESKHHKTLALTDPLTQTSNRLAFLRALQKRTDKAEPFALLLLDLNGFKQINDIHGHIAGDEVLVTLAERLSGDCNGHVFSLFRIGGDEFSIILDSIKATKIATLERCICELIEQPIQLTKSNSENAEVTISTSIGIARYPTDTDDYNNLISLADQHMYQMKFGQPSETISNTNDAQDSNSAKVTDLQTIRHHAQSKRT